MPDVSDPSRIPQHSGVKPIMYTDPCITLRIWLNRVIQGSMNFLTLMDVLSYDLGSPWFANAAKMFGSELSPRQSQDSFVFVLF